MNLIRRGSGANLNLFRYAAMVAMLLTLGIGNAWGHTGTHYATVTAKSTGNGKVYVTATNNYSVKDEEWETSEKSTSWNCGDNSNSDTKTYYFYAKEDYGYVFAGWSTSESTNTKTYASTPAQIQTTAEGNSPGKANTYYAHFWQPRVKEAVCPEEINVSSKGESGTATVTFKVSGAVAVDNFTGTLELGSGFTKQSGPTFSSLDNNGAGTVSYVLQYTAGDTHGESSATIELESSYSSTLASCTVNANFPKVTISGSDPEVPRYNVMPTEVVEGKAEFDVKYAATDGSEFVEWPLVPEVTSGYSGWTITNCTFAEGKVTVNYSFDPNGKYGNHTATLTLKATDAAGGASKTLNLGVVINEQSDKAAVVTLGGYEKEWATFAEALADANSHEGCTLKLLNDCEVNASQVFTTSMTLDLNGFELKRAGITAAGEAVVLNTSGKTLYITDTKPGAKGSIVAVASSSVAVTGINVGNGCKLLMDKGTINVTTPGTTARGIYATTTPTSENMVVVSDVTINTTAASQSIGIDCASSSATDSGDPEVANVILSNITINAETTGTTDAFAIRTNPGVCLLINSGTYNATAKTTTARAILTKGYTAIVNGSFNATAGTTDANAIRVEAGIAAVRNGSFKATTVQRIAHAGYVAANAKLLTYGGTFHGKSTAIIANGWATGTQVVSGGTLEAQGGTFIGEVANDGLTAAQTSYAAGIYANTGSNVTLANATLRGLTDNTYVKGAYALYTSTVNPVSLTNCTLEATSTDQYAYGVRLEGGATPLTMNNCTVNATAATLYAYGFYQNNATSTIDVTGSTFNVTSNGTRAYGIYVDAGTSFSATDCNFTVRTLQTSATAAAGSYLRGIFVAAGKTANLTGCTFNVSGHATYSTDAYGLYISGSVNVENTDVTISSVKSGYAIFNDENTAAINIFSGKFSATTAESNAKAAAAKQQLYGGYYVHNTNLAQYLPEGYMIETLTAGTEFNAGYKYHVRPETVVNDPVCKIGSTGYATLEEALDFVNKNSGNAYTIYMVKDYTLPAGDYTLPANATLLVPYMDGQTTAIGTTPSRAGSYATRSPYKTLTFASGVKMTVYGTIEASAQQNKTDQTSSGEVRGPFGYIILNENSTITLESGAKLIAWGFVCGKGTITVKDGAKAYEMLSLGWYKGGNTTSKLYNNASYKVFVMTDYAYQNIECAITYYPGAEALAAASTDYFSPNDVELVGTSTTSFFKMVKEEASADTWVRKEYDPKTDYTTWTMNNGASMSAIKLDSYSSENFYLPITSNFRIVLNYGEMTLGGDIEFHAGAELIIKKEATGKIASGKTVVFYDGDDWCTGLGSSGKYYYPVTYSPSWKAATGATTNPRLAKYKQLSTSAAPNYLPDAALFVQGKLEVSGNLYTTGDGNTATANRNSNIYSSNDDAGQIIYKTAAPANTSTKTMYKCTAMYGLNSMKGIKDMLANGNSTAYPALLQNGDGTYETTGGTAANSSWIYKNDHWVMVTTEGCFSVEQISGVKHYYAYPAGFVEVSSNTEDANHLYSDAATGNRRFLVDNDCVWWEVEPTPYDGNKYKCVTPDHNGKYKYYEYVGGWQEATVTVTWSINGTNTNYTVLYGTHPKYLSSSPSKASTATEYYTWTGWTKGSETGEFFSKDEALPVVTENTTFYAYFKADKFTFRATFNNYDGSLLETKLVAAGETPIYEGETPVKPSTTTKEYTFTGWSPELAAISNAPVTYTAQFSEAARKYTVQWVDYNGTVIKTEKVAYGTPPTAPSPNPSRPNDAFYTYTFDAWTPAIASVSGDQTYTATYNFEKKVTKYDIIFKNGTETVGSQSLPNGEIPVYGGTTPTKTPTAQYTYTFDGWSETDGGAKITGSLPAVSGANKTYYAHFATTTNTYKVYWRSEDGKVLYETDNNVPYGTTPSFDGATPTKDRVGKTGYTFDGWSATIGGDKLASLPDVTKDNVFYAHFLEGTYYNITFNAKGHGTAPAGYEVIGGSQLSAPEAPTETGYTFDGWYKEPACTNIWNFATETVTGDVTLYAKWTAVNYTISYELNGGILATPNPTSYTIESSAITLNNPTKSGCDFAGWTGTGLDAAVITVTIPTGSIGARTYAATWESAETGDPLDIVDWAASTLTINANGWTASGWPYTINGTSYDKGSRVADRTLTIPYSGDAGAPLSITVQSGGSVISKHNYRIPFINTAEGAGAEDVVYVNSGNVSIDASSTPTLAALYIRPEASVNVTNGTLSVGKLVLRTLPWKAASINGSYSATACWYTRIAPNKRTIFGGDQNITYEASGYYQFALPLNCTANLEDVKVSNNANTPYGNAWWIKRYDVASRATKGAGDNWVQLAGTEKVQGGVGYEFFSNSAYYREFYFPVGAVNSSSIGTTTAVTYNLDAAGAAHAGWNIVCSPLLRSYTNTPPVPEDMTVCWLLSDGKSYDQVNPTTIPAAIPFSYQASSGQNTLSFDGSSIVASAPRRRVAAAEEQTRIQWIHLDVADANGVGDQTSIYSHPTRYEQAYKTGIDVAKQSLTATRARIYSSHAYGEMAFAGVADSLLDRGVALTVYSPVAQELTFSLRDNNWLDRMESVWLIDKETGAMTDLLASDYSYEAAEGTTRGRFFIQGQFKAPNITTELEPTSDSSLKGREIRKLIINQKMFIEVNGRLYDATGKEVKR